MLSLTDMVIFLTYYQSQFTPFYIPTHACLPDYYSNPTSSHRSSKLISLECLNQMDFENNLIYYKVYYKLQYLSILDSISDHMPRTPLTETTPTLPQQASSCSTKCRQVTDSLDIFSYIPQPQAYPVSTKKSKIGSLIFIVLVVGYLTYDFVKFLTANSPLINSYQQNLPLDYQYQVPQVAFGFIYGPSLNNTLNDPSYFSFDFFTIQTQATEGDQSNIVEKKIKLNMTQNCEPQWLGEYNQVYRNLTCVSSDMTLMNIPSQNPQSITQRLTITGCQPNQNITCQSLADLFRMTSGGRLFLIVNLPAGFNYETGTVEQSEYSVEIYQFFLVPSLYNRITIQFYPFLYTTYPNFFTTFTSKQYEYILSYEPVAQMSNVSMYNPNIMMGITFLLYPALTLVDVEYQTFINRVSEWGALASLIMTVFGICCLTYNKNKFLQTNPGWAQFDQALAKKDKVIQIQLQNRQFNSLGDSSDSNGNGHGDEYEQSEIGGIVGIRRHVEATHDF